MKSIFGSLLVPLLWTIIIEILLCLPGSALPNADNIDIPYLDKIVHVIIFGAFVGFWCLYLSKRIVSFKKLTFSFFVIFLAACLNGISIEYIQLYCIPNRSFDLGDIIADVLSAGFSYGICNVTLLPARWNSFPGK